MSNPNWADNLRPWPKGTSGNPGGSSNRRRVTARLRKLLDETELEGPLDRTWVAMALGDEKLLEAGLSHYAG
jgi:hypothetical protein